MISNLRLYLTAMLLSAFGLFCYGQNSTIKLEKGEFPVKKILDKIQHQSGFSVFYSDEIVKDEMMIILDKSDFLLSELLNYLVRQSKLHYQFIDNKNLVIYDEQSLDKAKELKTNSLLGTIYDSKKQVIPYCTIKLYRGEVLMGTTVADHNGVFELTVSNLDGSLYLECTSLGYRSEKIMLSELKSLSKMNIVLKTEETVLAAVDVIAKTYPYQRLADRMVINVEGSVLGTGLSTLDVLQRSPGLWVDYNGNIKIRGNQSVIVMINDIVQRMSSDQLAEYLRAIPSESIKKIEVIPNPGAEYEAQGAGGIVRIQLKKGVNDGFKILLLARYTQKVKDPYFNGGTLFDYKSNNFYLSGAFAYKKDKQRYKATNRINYPDSSVYTSETQRFRNTGSYNARITSNYEISDKQSIGLQSTWSDANSDQDFYTNNSHRLPYDTLLKTTHNEWVNKGMMLNTTMNYLLKIDTMESTLKLIADHLYNDNKESNDYYLTSLNTAAVQRYINLSPNKTNIYSFQGDLNKNYGQNGSYTFGVKYVGTRRNNTVERNNLVNGKWELDKAYSNRFNYVEDLAMGYFTLNNKFNKFAVKAGLRAEQTYVKGISISSDEQITQKYLNLFPSVFLLYDIGKSGHALHLNYGKRVRRPSFKDLNPYTLQIDDFLLMEGNEKLKPEYIHRVEAGISLKQGVVVDLFYSNTQDKIVQFSNAIDNRRIKYQSINFKHGVDYGVNAFLPLKINEIWNFQSNLSYFKSAFQFGDVNPSQEVFEGSLSNFVKLKKWFDANLYLSYRSSYYIGNIKYADQFYSALILSRSVLKDKGKISLNFEDLFNTAREREYSDYQGTSINFYQKRPTQAFGISFTYMIMKGKKFKEKKIMQSNQDEVNRVN